MGTIKALTLWNPWAYLIWVAGHPDPGIAKLGKRIETRSWSTTYRGQLAIHSAKKFPGKAKERCWYWPFYQALAPAGLVDAHISANEHFKMALGAVIATCNLKDCILITPEFTAGLTSEERAFGDYTPGRFAWILEGVRQLPEPVPAIGRQGLWNWEPPEGVAI